MPVSRHLCTYFVRYVELFDPDQWSPIVFGWRMLVIVKSGDENTLLYSTYLLIFYIWHIVDWSWSGRGFALCPFTTSSANEVGIPCFIFVLNTHNYSWLFFTQRFRCIKIFNNDANDRSIPKQHRRSAQIFPRPQLNKVKLRGSGPDSAPVPVFLSGDRPTTQTKLASEE